MKVTRGYLGPGPGCSEALHTPHNNYTARAVLQQAPSKRASADQTASFISNSGILNLLNARLEVFVSKSLIHVHSILLDLQPGPLRDPCGIPSLHVLKPAASISTAHCTRRAGTTLQRGLCPFPNCSCDAKPGTRCPSCQRGGFGMAGRAPAPQPHRAPCAPAQIGAGPALPGDPEATVPAESIPHGAVCHGRPARSHGHS